MQPVETLEWQKEKFRMWSVGPAMVDTAEYAINLRMEDYGFYLEDGDFEKYQPCCYYNGGYTIDKWKRLKEEADKLYNTAIPGTIEYDRQELRIAWIRGRFIIWYSDEWQSYQNKIIDLMNKHTLDEWRSNKFW